MDPLEQRLKEVLGRQDPPAGFTRRVLARIVAPHRKPDPWRRLFLPSWRMALAGALATVLLAGGGVLYQQRQERLRGEAARDQLLQALEITSLELNRVRQTIRERGRP